jgi:N utilization substance protein A
MLTGYNIEVFRDIDEVDEEDIYLDEFRDEIDGWVIDQLKKIGCSTAKNVLATSRERLIKEADLEESTVDEILAVLRYEFEEEPDADIEELETVVDAEALADVDADTVDDVTEDTDTVEEDSEEADTVEEDSEEEDSEEADSEEADSDADGDADEEEEKRS